MLRPCWELSSCARCILCLFLSPSDSGRILAPWAQFPLVASPWFWNHISFPRYMPRKQECLAMSMGKHRLPWTRLIPQTSRFQNSPDIDLCIYIYIYIYIYICPIKTKAGLQHTESHSGEVPQTLFSIQFIEKYNKRRKSHTPSTTKVIRYF